MKLVTAEQMRELEARAVAAGVSEQEMMEQAGLAAAQEALVSAGLVEDRIILVLAGPGNNGGDGLVAARRLLEWEADVHVYMLAPRPEDDPQFRALVEAGVPWSTAEGDLGFERLDELLGRSNCVLDALLGTGHSADRPIEGTLAAVLRRLADAREPRVLRPRLIALDVPTGVDADTGAVDPLIVTADATVTFGYSKVGLFTLPGRLLAGDVVRVDIGIPAEVSADLPYEELTIREVQPHVPPRPPGAHKGTFGTAVLAAGSRRYPGAARLAAEAAARSGAGLVAIAAPQEVQALVANGLPDVVHEPLPATDGAVDGASALALLRALPGADVLLVGCGLSHTPATEEFVRSLLAALDDVERGPRAVVLDADALNALANTPDWHSALRLPSVLTPHPGEMARLSGCTPAQVQADRLGHATRYAEQTGSVVVLKGACTVVAAPDDGSSTGGRGARARISGVVTPMLATAGTGDVLAGLITGMLAQGMDPFEAACAGVYLHGECGKAVERAVGMAPGLAQDLLRALPDARRVLDSEN